MSTLQDMMTRLCLAGPSSEAAFNLRCKYSANAVLSLHITNTRLSST
jgi:hypothetical protein